MEGSPKKPAERVPAHAIYFRADQGLSGCSHLLVFLFCSRHCPGREKLILLVLSLQVWFLTWSMKTLPWQGGYAERHAKLILLPSLHFLSIQGITIGTHDIEVSQKLCLGFGARQS